MQSAKDGDAEAQIEKRYKSFTRIFLIVFNACLGSFLFGYFLSVFNLLQDNIAYINDWVDSPNRGLLEGIISAMIPLGALAGALIAGWLSSRLGRKNSFFIIDAICIVGCSLTMISGLPGLLIGRAICGVVVGLNSVIVPLYVREVSPTSVSGFFGAAINVMVNVGITVSLILGFKAPSTEELKNGACTYWWRVMFLFPIAICLFRSLMILLFFNYESPFHLVFQGKSVEAEEFLGQIYHDSYVGEELRRVKQRHESTNGTKAPWSSMFTRRYRSRLLLGVILAFVCQFSGVNAVTFYSQRIFTTYVQDSSSARIFTVMLGVANLVTNFVSGKIVDVSGRKRVYLIGNFLSMLFLALLAILYQYGYVYPSLAMIYAYSVSFNLSIGPLLYIILPEILPEQGIGLSVGANWIFAFIVGLTYPQMVESSLGFPGTFGLYACCCFVGGIFFVFLFKETKGKTNTEISGLYKGLKKKLITEETDY